MSQSDFGAALTVAFQQVRKYERGDNRVSASILTKVAEALDLSITGFFPPEKISAAIARCVEISAFRRGAALSNHFVAMFPAWCQVLLQVARESETDDQT